MLWNSFLFLPLPAPLFRFQQPASFLPSFRPLSHHLACEEFDKAGWEILWQNKEAFDITTFYSQPLKPFLKQQLSYGANVLNTIYIPRNWVVYARQLHVSFMHAAVGHYFIYEEIYNTWIIKAVYQYQKKRFSFTSCVASLHLAYELMTFVNQGVR